MDKGLRNFAKNERWREQQRMRRFYKVWLKYHPNKSASSMNSRDWAEFNNYYRAQVKADLKMSRQNGKAGYEGRRRLKYKTTGMDVGPSRHGFNQYQNNRAKADAYGVPQPAMAAENGGNGPVPPSSPTGPNGPHGGGKAAAGGKQPPHNPNKRNKKKKKRKKKQNSYKNAKKRKKYAEIYKNPEKGFSPKDKVLKTTVKDFKQGTKSYKQSLKRNNGRRYEVDDHGNLRQHSGTDVKPGVTQRAEAGMAKHLYNARDRMQNNNDADARNPLIMGIVQMLGDANKNAANCRLFQAMDLTNITHHIVHHHRYKRIVQYQNILDHDKKEIKRNAGIKAGIIKPGKRAKMKNKVLHIHPHVKNNKPGLHKSKHVDPDLREMLLALANRRKHKTSSISHNPKPSLDSGSDKGNDPSKGDGGDVPGLDM